MSTADDIIYEHEDVYTLPGMTAQYLGNQGSHWPFTEDCRFDLVGIFGKLRPLGRWPRAVNLWEMSWDKMCRAMEQQFFDPKPRLDQWWIKSSNERRGGWDRFCRPGPGSPSYRQIATGELRPCVVQQYVRLRDGAKSEYLAWVNEAVAPSVAKTRWKTLLWMGALHGSLAIVYHAAPDWDGMLELADALPAPDPSWRAVCETSSLQAWPASQYLRR